MSGFAGKIRITYLTTHARSSGLSGSGTFFAHVAEEYILMPNTDSPTLSSLGRRAARELAHRYLRVLVKTPPEFSRRLGATAALAASLALGMTSSASAVTPDAKGSPDRVIVTNPITIANPVTSVTVSNATPVPVSVMSAPPVTVNIDAKALARAMGVQRPFATSFNCTSNGVFSSHCTGSYTVPATERHIIEYVSHHCAMSVGSKFTLALQAAISTNDPVNSYGISVTDQTGIYIVSVGAILDGGQVTRIYAGAGTTVSAAGTAASATQSGTVDCNITVTGQAVDVP